MKNAKIFATAFSNINDKLPIVYNVNFEHVTPKCTLMYGASVTVDMTDKVIVYN